MTRVTSNLTLSVCTLTLFGLATVIAVLSSQDEMMQDYMSKTQAKRKKALNRVIPFVRCDICKDAMKHVSREIRKLRESTSDHKWSEELILEAVDGVCDPFSEKGEWLTMYEIKPMPKKTKDKKESQDDKKDSDKQKKKKKKMDNWNTHRVILRKKKPPTVDPEIPLDMSIGDCRRECETVSAACSEVVTSHDIEISDLLYQWSVSEPDKNQKKKGVRSKLTNQICPEYCSNWNRRKEKPMTYKTIKHLKKEVWRPGDPEQRQMMSMLGNMPPNVKMFDPSSAMFDDDFGGGFGDGMGFGDDDEDFVGMGDLDQDLDDGDSDFDSLRDEL